MAKILLLTPYNPDPNAAVRHVARYGGVERYVWKLATELTRRGEHVSILTSDSEDGLDVVDGIPIMRARRLASIAGAAIFDWARYLSDAEWDVVHVQGSYPFLSEFAGLACARLRIPSVLTYHFDVTGRNSLEWVAARAYNLFYLRCLRFYDRILVHSKEYLATSPARIAIRQDQLRLSTVGIDTDLFRPHDLSRQPRMALFVGRLAPYKGLPVLLDALRRIPDWHLVLVGDGVLREYVQRRTREEGLRVEWKGRVDDAELVRLYNLAAVTVLPSTDRQECFGTVLAESLACGTPVVTTEMPGREYVKDFKGALVSPGDPAALARAIDAVGSGPIGSGDRLSMAHAVASRFGWSRVAESLGAAYSELISGGAVR